MRVRFLALAAFPLLGSLAPAFAGNIVTNGNFASQSESYSGTGTNFYTPGGSVQIGTYGVAGENGAYTAALTGWTIYGEGSSPYALYFNNATATTQTALSTYDTVTNNVLTGSEVFRNVPSNPPAAGFLALDGGTGTGNGAGGVSSGVYQAVQVTRGSVYQLTFSWAAAQLVTGSGNFNLDLFFGLSGSPTLNTATAAYVTPCVNGTSCLPTGSTYGWLTETAYFEATTTGTEYLSFFALGSIGNPPMALLDGVSLVDAPEPGSLAVVLAGVGGLAFMQRRRMRARV